MRIVGTIIVVSLWFGTLTPLAAVATAPIPLSVGIALLGLFLCSAGAGWFVKWLWS